MRPAEPSSGTDIEDVRPPPPMIPTNVKGRRARNVPIALNSTEEEALESPNLRHAAGSLTSMGSRSQKLVNPLMEGGHLRPVNDAHPTVNVGWVFSHRSGLSHEC